MTDTRKKYIVQVLENGHWHRTFWTNAEHPSQGEKPPSRKVGITSARRAMNAARIAWPDTKYRIYPDPEAK